VPPADEAPHPTSMPLLLFKPMGQLQRGVSQVLEAQRPLVAVILRFTQMGLPLLPLKPMGQSPVEGAPEPPEFEPPHALIDPSVLIAAKALIVE
jgi:hypothetical protein